MGCARAHLAFLEVLQHVGQPWFLERPVLSDAGLVNPVTILIPDHVVVLGPIDAKSQVIVEGRVRRRNLVHGPPGQDLDRLEVREDPRAVGLGHDVILDHALRTVGQKVTAGVMLQVCGSQDVHYPLPSVPAQQIILHR